MEKISRKTLVCIAATFLFAVAPAQSKPKNMPNPAHMKLSAEVAATTDDGYPAVLRVTLKNVGNLAVDMPVLSGSCSPDHGVEIRMTWALDDLENPGGGGIGGGCYGGDGSTVVERVRNEWIRLRPGEFMTTSLNIRAQLNNFKPATVEFWVEYDPPNATPKEVDELLESGFVIPTEKLATEHWSFTLR